MLKKTIDDIPLIISGLAQHLAEKQASGEPDVSDGCDKDGFAGGCVRAGHTTISCPGLQVGDIVKLGPAEAGAGSIGIIVGWEVWRDQSTPIVWGGYGQHPGIPEFDPPFKRFLVKILDFSNTETKFWNDKCMAIPHNFPYITERSVCEVVARPVVKQLGEEQYLVQSPYLPGVTCGAPSEGQARWALAQAIALTSKPPQ